MRSVRTIFLLVITGVLFACGGGNSPECQSREAILQRRIEVLRNKAQEALKIGATREDVKRFFADNKIPLSFDQFGATGTLYTSGCSPRGCGLNDAIIGVRIPLDQEGKVRAEATVIGMYTDCL